MVGNTQLFCEMEQHLLKDAAPSEYFNHICESDAFAQHPFSLLLRLKDVPQSPIHHPEGNVWNHTMLVVDEAAKYKHESNDPTALLWAALLHDIGKAETTRTRKGKITAYDHDKASAVRTREFLGKYMKDEKLIDKITALVRWHMQILFVIKSMKFANIEGMKRDTDLKEIALLGFCDRMGRLNADEHAEREHLRQFLEKCEPLDNN
ncbi:HDIG domain-containing protein [Anoxybacterium hadale]|uniref:HDIG domain-containing protein n=1 Tax=Anoxybacterium hadale TaxID=3408580 RepID=A0ACD1AFV3_9FIRM|nr:HDIG domain-containing protein [Clostridiales bacterium]